MESLAVGTLSSLFGFGSVEHEFAFVLAAQWGRNARERGVSLPSIHRESGEDGFGVALANYSDGLQRQVDRHTDDAMRERVNVRVAEIRADIIGSARRDTRIMLHD